MQVLCQIDRYEGLVFEKTKNTRLLKYCAGEIGFLGSQSITHHRNGASDSFEKKTRLVKWDGKCRVLTTFESKKKLGNPAVIRNGRPHLPEKWD